LSRMNTTAAAAAPPTYTSSPVRPRRPGRGTGVRRAIPRIACIANASTSRLRRTRRGTPRTHPRGGRRTQLGQAE
jgi:hypothetical protein